MTLRDTPHARPSAALLGTNTYGTFYTIQYKHNSMLVHI